MTEHLALRPLTDADVEAVDDLVVAAFSALTGPSGQHRRARDETGRRRSLVRLRHLLATDAEGAWVAERRGHLAGVGLALLREERLWGLSLLAVHPAALAGFALRPCLDARGTVRRDALPRLPTVREADAGAADLAADVDRAVRGASHGTDLPLMLDTGGRLLVVDQAAGGRGYAVHWDGSPWLLAATDPATARSLLWGCLVAVPDGAEASVGFLSAEQQWAIEVVLAAGLALSAGGAVCTRGELGPLSPYLPSGAYL